MRRIVPSILVLMQLAQGMAFSHSHVGTGVAEPAEHSQRPHFHFGGFCSHRHDHEDEHSHPHHPHHHDDGQVPGEEPASDGQLPQIPPADHDSNAVYVSDGAVSDRALPRASSEPWHQLFLSIDTAIPRISTVPAVTPPQSLPPPFPGQFSCPIFLQTLALLI